MKKVGIVISDISRDAGTERAVANLCNILVKNSDYEVYIFSVYTLQGDVCYYQLPDSVKIIHLEMRYCVNFRKIKNYINLIVILKKEVKKYGVDYLLGTTHAYNSLLLFQSKCKRIACEHMNYDACPGISKFIRRIIYPKLDAIVLLTKADCKKYTFIDETKKFVIPNSLSFTSESPAIVKKKRMIAVGRLTNQKGYDLLIDMAIRLKEKLPEWHIDIFGEGEDREKLENLITKNKVNDFIKINNPVHNIKKELLDSSIYLLPSRYEGMGLVLLEAQTCGLPIVAFNCPEGPAEVIVNDSNGYLIPIFDTDEFVEKTVKLANDERLRCKFGKEAFADSRRFSETVIYKKWNYLFQCLSN